MRLLEKALGSCEGIQEVQVGKLGERGGYVVDNSLCRMKSEAASQSRGRPEAKGRVHFQGLGCMPSLILQGELCSLTHSKRYGHVAIPLSGDMTYRVGQAWLDGPRHKQCSVQLRYHLWSLKGSRGC